MYNTFAKSYSNQSLFTSQYNPIYYPTDSYSRLDLYQSRLLIPSNPRMDLLYTHPNIVLFKDTYIRKGFLNQKVYKNDLLLL